MTPTRAMPEGFAIRHADSVAELHACWPAMRQLRPHLRDAQDMAERMQRMRDDGGYRLLAVWHGEEAIALAGYRLQENLVYGRFLYVDDLVTLEGRRGGQWGARLLDEATLVAEQAGCAKLVLDTGLANALAQRFYFREGLLTGSMRFSKVLGGAAR
jgi:ribosomal protein S18 acetylase RimI-like enzyme